MPHVTFIHGIANKPPHEELLRLWLRSLEAGDASLSLGTYRVSSEMVYWADLLYDQPLALDSALESAAILESGEQDVDSAGSDVDLEPAALSEEERDLVLGLAAKLGVAFGVEEAATEARSAVEEKLERIPLPWFVKRRLMKILLRDVHHYLFDVEHRGMRIQQEIRRRFLASLARGAEKERPHVVVSHSMGTVIAYDCLKRVGDCAGVDHLMTIGSPLGLDEIQDKLRPEWTRDDGFPSGKVSGRWVNVFDRLDPVAGLDSKFRNDYRKGGAPAVEDIHEASHGRWRHSIGKYLAGSELRGHLASMLGLPAPV